MRPISAQRNILRCPLDELLGKPAAVRILRELAEQETPLSVKDLCDRTGVTAAGIHGALKRLRQSGYVVEVGGTTGRRHTLRWSDPLTESLVALFATERTRYEEMLDAIRAAFYQTSPPPISAWISRLPKELSEPLQLTILGDAKTLSESVRNLRSALAAIEQHFDVTIELEGYTKADLPGVQSVGHIYLAGAPTTPDGRQRLGDQGFDLSRASSEIARLIERDPSLVTRARRHLDRVMKTDHGAERYDLEEWRDILNTYSTHRLVSFLNSSGERATRLMQSSPFLAVLSDEEKERIRLAGSQPR